MKRRHVMAFSALAVLIGLLFFNRVAYSADVVGAWANDTSACSGVFVRGKSGVTFSKTADSFGSGFIIDRDRIKGKMVTCRIRSQKTDAAVLHLAAVCSTDVALGLAQFSLKVVDDEKIIRLYPGLPELDVPYYRCRM